jgi:hypothetical protein
MTFVRAVGALARCVVITAALIARRRLHQPADHVGDLLHFADGSSARVYRETVVGRHTIVEPAVLVVEFQLRWVRGRGHTAFRAESLLNTVLFAGFPGFVSKLWLAHDEHAVYRGFYQWDGAGWATEYVRALWWVLSLVSVRGSIHYAVVPGLWRDDVLRDPRVLDVAGGGGLEWWRLVSVEPRGALAS